MSGVRDAFYNENEPYAAEWLSRLCERDLIRQGHVDSRSIVALRSKDVRGYTQAHFFAGIGGWSYALRLAGWPDDAPVWTGSCPCQPFSTAGQRRGEEDERHLWPTWFKLIRQCRPPIVFGEQVASPDGLRWLDAVLDDLERAGYACGAADTCAASVGAPHIRQRLYFVALAGEQRRERERLHLRPRRSREAEPEAPRGGASRVVADPAGEGRRRTGRSGEEELQRSVSVEPRRQGSTSRMADVESDGRHQGRSIERRDEERARQERRDQRVGSGHGVEPRGMGNSGRERSRRDAGAVLGAKAARQQERLADRDVDHEPRDAGAARLLGDAGGKGSQERQRAEERFGAVRIERAAVAAPGATSGFWKDAEWWLCRDGKARPTQPGSFPLVDGLPDRVGKLRAYGNAIVPEQAALFIEAVMPLIGL